MDAISYRVAPLDAHAHLYEVSCTVPDPDPAGQTFTLPTWTPGSYLVREFARHFVKVSARAGNRTVPIGKLAKDTWKAAPCEGPLEVVAQVYACDLSVRAAWLDAERAYFNGASLFLCPAGRAARRCTLELDPRFAQTMPGAIVATSMRAVDGDAWGFGPREAADYDELIDHPVEVGRFVRGRFAAGGATHDIAISGAGTIDMARLEQDLARICQWQCDLFDAPGRAPFDRYLFLVHAVGEGYGGLEHRASTSLLCARDELPHPADKTLSEGYLRFLGLASHEYFHAWNVKRIKPAAFVPYELSHEAYTRELWAFEGITSYYDDLSLARSGVVPAERVLELFARTLTGVLRTPGRHLQSLGDASHDAWIKFYRPDENASNAGVSYYAKGALVALALDLTLREHASSLDALMRALWQRYGKTGRGVEPGAIAALAGELAGRDLRTFFDRYVDGVDDPPLDALLPRFGVALALRAAEGPRDKGGKPASPSAPSAWLGATWPANGELKLGNVVRDGPASRAGLSANDVIIAVDGLKAGTESLAARLAHAKPGDTLVVDAFRRDRLMHVELTLAAPPLDTAVLTLASDADATALARRRAWLGA